MLRTIIMLAGGGQWSLMAILVEKESYEICAQIQSRLQEPNVCALYIGAHLFVSPQDASQHGFRCAACRHFLLRGTARFLLSPATRRGDDITTAYTAADATFYSECVPWCLACLKTLRGLKQLVAATRRLTESEISADDIPF